MSVELPDGWEVKSLAEVAKINIGGTPSRSNDAYWAKDSDGFTWVSISDLKSGTVTRSKERITQSGISNSNVKLVQAGTVLMSFKLTVGRVAVAGVDLYTNEAIAAFDEDKTVLDRGFLAQFLPIFVNRIETEQAVKGRTLNKQSLSQIPITLPPLPEQQRIAEILSSVDESIRATEAVIAQAERVKRGLMEDLLTGGLGSAAIANGEVPDGWMVRQIGDFSEVKGGKRMPKGAPFSDEVTPYPYIRVSDFKNGGISTDDIKYVSKEHQSQISRYTIGKEDIYISIAGTLGVVGLVPEKLDGAQLTENAAKVVIREKTTCRKEYLALVLQSELGQAQIHLKKGVGGGVPKLALFRIAEIKVPLPPMEVQTKIAETLVSVDDQIIINRVTVKQLQRLKRGLMDDLLTGKVRAVS